MPEDPRAPVLQLRSEGGFVPVEVALGTGPRATLLADRSLIYEGPVIAIYPGPLLPNYQVGKVTEEEMDEVLRLVEEMGLPEISEESDLDHGGNVADATTEIVTFWDENGKHTYSVYALGIDPTPDDPRTAAFLELFNYVLDLTGTIDAEPWVGETVQLIAGPGFADPAFPDARDWPLDGGTDDWTVLPNEWRCTTTEDADVLGIFEDATSATTWASPDDFGPDPLKLVVRTLHPGEETCFGN